MQMNIKAKKIGCGLLALLLLFTAMFPSYPGIAIAAQENNYHDPAENWLTSGNRTNELDSNAVVTRETFTCYICGKQTEFTVWRTPEYTKDGRSALSRNVMFSDGTMIDGENTGTILDGTPGVNAYYTGYHWTKAVCEKCGSMNSHGEITNYEFGKNVYTLYDCESKFTEELPETVSYAYADKNYHTKTSSGGSYCCFCFGTNKTESSVMERHDLAETVIPQLGNQRFMEKTNCTLCDYTKTGYVAAKSVIADYYGVADGRPHTISVTDLADSGVKTRIRYGLSADSCTLFSAPNFTEAGQYTVYYEITYTYKNQDMTENGVAYVWLRDETSDEDGPCTCGCGEPNCGCQNKNCGGSCCANNTCGDAHHFVLLDSTKASCLTLGYDRYLCNKCGKIEKRDYVNALGHAWQGILIREATCEQDGKLLEICSRCGEVKETVTPPKEHEYAAYTVKATCTNPGYNVQECAVCGERQITDITNVLPHNYQDHILAATCETGGHTVHLCAGCGSSFVTDYTEALGHSWDDGTYLTNATCTGEGVMEYRCVRCGYHRLEGDAVAGHIPGAAATCTENQVCTVCGAILNTATGHKESDWIIDKQPTLYSSGSKHKECLNCGETMMTAKIEKLYNQATTDMRGEATVGDYLVIVSDTKTSRPVANATVTLDKDKGLAIRLPNSRLLDYDKQTTVTVRKTKDNSAVSDLLIEVSDKNDNYCAAKTNRVGKITVPDGDGSTNSDGRVTVGFKDEDGERLTWTVLVNKTETGRPIENAAISITKSGNITVKLPDGTDMDDKHRITVTVKDNQKEAVREADVTVKNDLGGKASGQTDKNGKVTVPVTSVTEYHAAYVVGYPDGCFHPEQSMTRGEAAAILARLLAERNGDNILTGSYSRFYDVKPAAWYAAYVRYLSDYGIALGRNSNKFAPNEPITRAEFTAMAVRFFAKYSDEAWESDRKYALFDDVQADFWGANYIAYAAKRGWVMGYSDGSFRADNNISRAEIVTLLNRLLERQADNEYIADNLRRLNSFGDVGKWYWAYADIMEAANSHKAEIDEEAEEWIK